MRRSASRSACLSRSQGSRVLRFLQVARGCSCGCSARSRLSVLLLILNNLGYLYETISIGIPFTGIAFGNWPTTEVVSPFCAAVLGLTLHHAAFSAEVIRGGIQSVDQGQLEAAAALGLAAASPGGVRIELPQAMRAIVPTAFNDLISLAKGSAMVYVLAMPELFYTVQIIYRRNLEVIPLLMVATVWYLIILSVLSAIQVYRGALFLARRDAQHNAVAIRRGDQGACRISCCAGAKLHLPASRGFADAIAPSESKIPGAANPWIDQRTGGEIVIQKVSKSFGALKVLDNVSLTMRPGSVTVILGQSGSGKSTLLRTINHLERVDDGLIDIDGELIGYRRDGMTLYELKERDVLRRRGDVGMVFQNFNLFPHLERAGQHRRGAGRAWPLAAQGSGAARAGSACACRTRGQGARVAAAIIGRTAASVAIARALALRPKVLVVRRADIRSRSRTGERSARRHQGTGALRHHDGHRHDEIDFARSGSTPSCSWIAAGRSKPVRQRAC